MNNDENHPSEGWLTVVPDFVKKLVGPSIEQIGEIAGDWARYWRMHNWTIIAEKTEKLLAKKGLQAAVSPIPPGLAFLTIQQASFEDDPNLQDLWAGLLANAMTGGSRHSVAKLAVRILSEMEPLDAKILLHLSKQGWMTAPSSNPEIMIGNFTLEKISEDVGVDQSEVRVSLYNLFRLGLIADERKGTFDALSVITTRFLATDQTNVILTALGHAFIEACDTSEGR
ncbi:MAG: DUF4393 domain-containing protein [Alphaproteobacteria bacterium]|nr:MAG: DUF4393 domain-containing protein [Alphaproteobacteria bacterium]